MDLGEYIFMRVAIALFIPLMIAVVSFLFHLIRKGLHTLLHRNNAPKQADPPRPAPQPAVQKPEKPAKNLCRTRVLPWRLPGREPFGWTPFQSLYRLRKTHHATVPTSCGP